MTDDMGTPEDSAVEPERAGLRANLRALYQCTNDFDFTRLFKRGLVIAVLVSVISIISLFTRGLNLGIDFKGGSVWEVPVTDVSVDDARDVMEGVGLGDAKIQLAVNADGTKILRVQADVTEVDASREVTGDLADLAEVPVSDIAVNTVGPSWGDEITRQAQRALVYFFIAITLYISFRLEWKMAVGALVSMAHDLLLSVGVYSILQIEVTPATLISFLTILGYSLYDTIVVFDRALENSSRTVAKTPYRVIMNRTLNQTLMRSVNTTVATILPIISMLIFGALLLGAKTLAGVRPRPPGRPHLRRLLVPLRRRPDRLVAEGAGAQVRLHRRGPGGRGRRGRRRVDRPSGPAGRPPVVRLPRPLPSGPSRPAPARPRSANSSPRTAGRRR